MTLTLDSYQDFTGITAVYPRENAIEYVTLGLCGESGEIANKVKKVLRKDNIEGLTHERREAIIDEMGDVLWYLARLASELAVPLSDVARRNMDKLTQRKMQGFIKGDGDDRGERD